MKTHQIYRVLLAGALFQFIAFASSAQATIYASITAQTQGEIKGDAVNKPNEGKIECTAFSSELVSPRDIASGMAAGKRQYKPIMLMMHFDSSTPKLLKAASSNEMLKTVKLEFMKPNPSGVVANFATITLTNASIASIEEIVENKETGGAAKSPFNVRITLTFQKIETTSLGGTPSSTSDDWQARM